MVNSIGTLYFVEQAVYKAEKALVTAKFAGLPIDTKKFEPQKDARKPDFLAKNPTGKVPFLETERGCIFSSNAIARYVARCREDKALYGKCFDDECDIDTWMEFCTFELEVPLMCWVYPTMGLMEEDSKATSEAQADVKKALKVMETQLAQTQFLIGDFLTVADITLVCSLREGFTRVFDAGFRKAFPKVTAWFEQCCAMPQFVAVFGKVTLCSSPAKAQAVLKEFLPPARGEKKKEEKGAAPAPAAKKQAASAQAKVVAAPPAAAPAAAASGGSAGDVEAVGNQIRALKEKLKADGLSGKKINDHEEVKKLVAKLQALKEGAASTPVANGAAPAAAAPLPTPPAPAAGGGDLDAQIKSVGDEIRTLKEKLKADGLSGKKINDHAEVKALVGKLTELKAKA